MRLDKNILPKAGSATGPGERRKAAGTALIIVLVLLSVMGALIASNIVTLRQLRVELKLLEARQVKALALRAGAPAQEPAATNAVPVRSSRP